MIVKRQDYAYDDDLAELQNEIKFHKKASLTGSNQIVHLRDATRREELSMVYIYMDYSPGGDLYTLAWKAENEKKQIPEIYLWIIFDAISEALHILKTGQAAVFDDVGEAIEVENSSGWGHPLVHLDIKPDNIFLGAPTAPYMGYLTPQLGDFGQVAEYYEGVDYDDLRGGGTPGWGPPEQRDPPEDMWEVPYTDWADGALTEPLDDKSDIWTLGLVIWTLMRSSSFNHDEMEAARDELRFDDEERESVFAADIVAKLPRYDGMYSTKLEDLVKKCLEVKRVRRPDILELRGETCKGLLKAQEVFGNPAVARKEDLMEHLRLSFREEIFKIGGPGPERWKNRKKRKAPARVDSPVTAYGDSDGDGSGSKRRKTRSVHGDGEQRVQGDDDNSGNVIRPSNDEEDDNNVPEAQGPQIEDPNIDRPAGLVQVAAPTDPIRLGLLDAAFSGDPTGRSGFLWYNAVLSARAKDELKWYLGKGRYPSLIKKWDKLNNDDKAMYRRWT
ncbi:kinase-like protein [Lophium mytilinum]|uniref:non-specific serine/threonine protein kinase n=1 Tax=Lophium mytilinum TaxID=390894 RepID=A0A6A6QXA2_9PEZI|nr:kinase-like protein [Lophium mytilinum]